MSMTYTQIYDLGSANDALRKKVAGAVSAVAAYVIAFSGATATQKSNAKVALASPWQAAGTFLWYVVNDTNIQADENATPGSATDAHVRAVIDAKWPELWA